MEKTVKEKLEEKIDAFNQKVELEQIALDSDPDRKKIKRFTTIAWWAVGIGAFLFLVGIFFFIYPTCSIELTLNELGDYLAGSVGGLWALAGLFFIYVAFLGQKLQLKTQQLELKYSQIEVMSTRLELMGQKEQMIEQNLTLRQQRFENTFFQLLSLHHEIVDKLRVSHPNNVFEGRACFDWAVRYLAVFDDGALRKNYDSNKVDLEVIREVYSDFSFEFGHYLKHYFNNLYNLFEFIHLNTQVTDNEKAFYANIVSAQLTDSETQLLFYHLLGPQFGYPHFKYLDQEYNILQHLDEINHINEDHIYIFDHLKAENPYEK